MKEKAQLPPSVAADFELTSSAFSRTHFCGAFGVVDFNTLTLTEARRLVNIGFPHLRRKVSLLPKSSPKTAGKTVKNTDVPLSPEPPYSDAPIAEGEK